MSPSSYVLTLRCRDTIGIVESLHSGDEGTGLSFIRTVIFR